MVWYTLFDNLNTSRDQDKQEPPSNIILLQDYLLIANAPNPFTFI